MQAGEREPWLRGPLEGVDPMVAPVLRSLQQVREDLRRHTEGLDEPQVWMRPFGLAPLGFQLRHIAGSVDRLMTYARGEALSEAQLEAVSREMLPGSGVQELLEAVDRSLDRFDAFARAIPRSALLEQRFVGRRRYPVTLHALLVHIAEHSQRHTGQAISAARLARAWREANPG